MFLVIEYRLRWSIMGIWFWCLGNCLGYRNLIGCLSIGGFVLGEGRNEFEGYCVSKGLIYG